MNKEKAVIIVTFIAIFLLFLGTWSVYLVDASETDNFTHNNVEFEWTSIPPGQRVVKVKTETETVVPFKVRFKTEVSKIKFLIPKKFNVFGIRIDEGIITVKAGIADFKVVFKVPSGIPLGRYELPILIVDPLNGQEIGKGVIPFILLPSDIECRC